MDSVYDPCCGNCGTSLQESGEEDKEALADEPPSQTPTELVSEATAVDEAVGSNEENKVQFSSQVSSYTSNGILTETQLYN